MKFPRWYSRADWAIVPDHNDFDFDASESFTVEAWLNLGTYGGFGEDHQIVLDGYNWPARADGWGLSLDGANWGAKFVLIDGGSVYLDARSDGPLNDDQWHHVAAVREIVGTGEQLRLYVDGVLQTSDPTTYSAVARDLSNSEGLWIGGADHPNCYGGYLDELRISQGVLRPSEFLNAPEPATLTLLALGGLGLLRRRRKR